MKLSPRLARIDNMIDQTYDQIWDCCCDHGLLGRQLLLRGAARQMHFVDVVPHLVNGLQQLLSEPLSGFSDSNWQTHCLDVSQLLLPSGPEAQTVLMVIAGVGGDLTIELVQGILANNPGRNIEFVLCPVRQQYQVRKQLADVGLALINEQLVLDNGLYYEVLHLTTAAGAPLTLAGQSMWDFSQAPHRDYLHRTLQHYQRMQRSGKPEVEQIVKQYQLLLACCESLP